MNKSKLLVVSTLCVSALLGAGCSSSTPSPARPNVPTPVTQSPSPAIPTPTVPSQTASIVDACVAVTPAVVKQVLGLDVGAGVSKNSNLQGSTCELKSSDKKTAIIVQLTAKGETYYQPDTWFKNGRQLGVGDKGIYLPPVAGGTTVQMMKNGSLAYVTISSIGHVLTDAEVKAFMQVIADKL